MMTFDDLQGMIDEGLAAFSKENPLREVSIKQYASLSYPKLLPLMRFRVRMFASDGFGNVSVMHTRAMGMMQLATFVFTPNLGKSVPLLLVDVMKMGKKLAAFVEYYDLTANGCRAPLLARVAQKHEKLPDYPEKPAWYVSERAAYSLIKGGNSGVALSDMLSDTFAAYGKTAADCLDRNDGNLAQLVAFCARMVTEGNPSDATMTRVLGADGAKRFYSSVVMPPTYIKN